MNLLLWGITIGTIGKVILGIAVLRVHVHIIRERKIDTVVLQSLKREQYVTAFGLALIVLGFIMEILFYNTTPDIMNCIGQNCATIIQAIINR